MKEVQCYIPLLHLGYLLRIRLEHVPAELSPYDLAHSHALRRQRQDGDGNDCELGTWIDIPLGYQLRYELPDEGNLGTTGCLCGSFWLRDGQNGER